ncbi:hypothetical protein HYW18_01625 [Candidatus Uhrbacteria bacterium]|nr:hypothetical protein [Candidatus Uhrbacteria bacterium]
MIEACMIALSISATGLFLSGLLWWGLLGGVAVMGMHIRNFWRTRALLSEEAFGVSFCWSRDANDPLARTVGLFWPTIVLSREKAAYLSPKQLHALLAHEASHKTYRDGLWRSLLLFFERWLFFFPTLSDIAEHIRLRQEVRADHAAIHATDASVLQSLYLLAPETANASPLFAFSSRRLSVIFDGASLSWHFHVGRLLVTILSLTLLVAVFSFDTASAATVPSCQEFVNMSAINFSPLR